MELRSPYAAFFSRSDIVELMYASLVRLEDCTSFLET
jgi:hypothetical protein